MKIEIVKNVSAIFLGLLVILTSACQHQGTEETENEIPGRIVSEAEAALRERTAGYPENWWMHGNFVAWDDDKAPIWYHWRLAHALGYYLVAQYRHEDVQNYKEDMWFLLTDPQKSVQPDMKAGFSDEQVAGLRATYPQTMKEYPELPRAIHEKELAAMEKAHPEAYGKIKAAFERNKAWSHPGRKFPNNLAQLQSWDAKATVWEACPDYQQQRVIDESIDNLIRYIKEQAEVPDKGYLFKGFIIDVIEIWDEFDWNSNRSLPGEPNEQRHAIAHDGITHDYETLREGWLQFLAQLRDRCEREFPDRETVFLFEPTPIYDKWVAKLKEADEPSITPELIAKARGDALLQEKPGLRFLEDEQLRDTGWWPLSRLGSCTGDLFTTNPHYPTQLKYFGKCAVRGSWFISFGTFDRSRSDISKYSNEFKLIRALSGWENMNQTPVTARVWDHEKKTYLSPTAWATPHALAGVHPVNGKLYGILLDGEARIPLAEGIEPTAFTAVNSFMEPDAAQPAPPVRLIDGALAPDGAVKFPITFICDLPEGRSGSVFARPEGLELKTTLSMDNLLEKEIMNPDFEEGITGWSFGRAYAKGEAVTSPVRHGAKAARVFARSAGWHAASLDVTGYLMQHLQGRYRLSAWLRTRDGQSGTAELGLAFIERGERKGFNGPRVEIGPEWARIEHEFDLDWNDWIMDGEIIIRGPKENTDYFIDDVRFEKVTE
jgi:hypothetical protein